MATAQSSAVAGTTDARTPETATGCWERSPGRGRENAAPPCFAYGKLPLYFEATAARPPPPGHTNVGCFAGRDVVATTQTFRVEAEGLIDDEPRARLTAVVRKRTEGTGDVLVILDWSGRH